MDNDTSRFGAIAVAGIKFDYSKSSKAVPHTIAFASSLDCYYVTNADVVDDPKTSITIQIKNKIDDYSFDWYVYGRFYGGDVKQYLPTSSAVYVIDDNSKTIGFRLNMSVDAFPEINDYIKTRYSSIAAADAAMDRYVEATDKWAKKADGTSLKTAELSSTDGLYGHLTFLTSTTPATFKATFPSVMANLDNFVIGSAFDDTIESGHGQDTINAGSGSDSIFEVGSGNNIIGGGRGDDQLSYERATDGVSVNIKTSSKSDKVTEMETIRGSSGDDHIKSADDVSKTYLYGGAGEDTLRGAEERLNFLYGGADDDFFYGGKKHDLFAGDEGKDTIVYDAKRARIDVDVRSFSPAKGGDGVATDAKGANKIGSDEFKTIEFMEFSDAGRVPLVDWDIVFLRDQDGVGKYRFLENGKLMFQGDCAYDDALPIPDGSIGSGYEPIYRVNGSVTTKCFELTTPEGASQVPGRSAIQIHAGVNSQNSEGCIVIPKGELSAITSYIDSKLPEMVATNIGGIKFYDLVMPIELKIKDINGPVRQPKIDLQASQTVKSSNTDVMKAIKLSILDDGEKVGIAKKLVITLEASGNADYGEDYTFGKGVKSVGDNRFQVELKAGTAFMDIPLIVEKDVPGQALEALETLGLSVVDIDIFRLKNGAWIPHANTKENPGIFTDRERLLGSDSTEIRFAADKSGTKSSFFVDVSHSVEADAASIYEFHEVIL